MGNQLYRPTPRRTHNTEEGHHTFYDYGASQITGWRHKQEDRYICLPKFFEDLSLFAVYDGHGGEQVVQYLQRYLHQHIFNELKLHGDPELSLYLGFLTCDNSLKNITAKEFSVIQDDLELEFDVADSEERREVIFGCKSLISSDSAGTSKDDSDSVGTRNNGANSAGTSKEGAESSRAIEDSSQIPGTSKGISHPNIDDLRSEVISACLNQLPSIFFLTQAPFEKEDEESDEDYEPQRDNIKHDIFETSEENDESAESDESSELEDESSGKDDDESSEKEAEESVKKDAEKYTEKKAESAQKKVEQSPKKGDEECAVKEVAEQSGESNKRNNHDKKNSKTGNHSGCINEESQENKGITKAQNVADIYESWKKPNSDFGATCGSTATVLLINEKNLFIANVGDSRCVACINGQAVDLSIDHKPTIEEENIRIISAGGTVSEDERVNGFLDMSRAFGDFGFKQKKVAEPFQILSCEPHIATVEVTPDLEFIILASDGIWNTMDSNDVIHYLKNRMQETGMELRDICGEMFEEMLPSHVTADGSGCDNMTAILIQFKKSGNDNSATCVESQECYKYCYPPQHRKKYVIPDTDTSEKQKDVLSAHDSEESKPQSKEVESCRSTSGGVQADPGKANSAEQLLNISESLQRIIVPGENEPSSTKDFKDELDEMNLEVIQAKREVENAILNCTNFNSIPNEASSSNKHPNAEPGCSSHTHPNADSCVNFPMVNFGNLRCLKTLESAQDATKFGSMTELNEADQNVAEVIDLCSDDSSNDNTVPVVKDTESSSTQSLKRNTEDADEASKKIKSSDFTSFNAEKHK